MVVIVFNPLFCFKLFIVYYVFSYFFHNMRCSWRMLVMCLLGWEGKLVLHQLSKLKAGLHFIIAKVETAKCVTISPQSEAARLMLERGLLLFGSKFNG